MVYVSVIISFILPRMSVLYSVVCLPTTSIRAETTVDPSVSPQPPSQTGQSQRLAQNRPKKRRKKKNPSVEMKHGCQLLTLDYKPNLDFVNISKYPDRLQRGVGNGHGRAGGRPGQGVTLRGGAQSCPSLCNPMDCSPPGSSAHGIFQARILEGAVISFSKGSS